MRSRLKLIKSTLILSVFLSLPYVINAQKEEFRLDQSYSNIKWNDFVNKVETNYSVRFFYDQDSLSNFLVLIPEKTTSFSELLNTILKPYRFKAFIGNNGNIIVTNNTAFLSNIPESFYLGESSVNVAEAHHKDDLDYKNSYLKTDNAFIYKHIVIGQKSNDNKSRVTVSGYVKSGSDDAPIVGGTLHIKETGKTIATDASGFYALHLKKGIYTLLVSSLESKTENIKLEVLSDGRYDLQLEPKLVALEEIIVSSEKEHIVRNNQMGYQKLVAKEVKEIPLVLGEADIVKVSLLLPGIQSVGEGSAGFNVRGSPTDQNLFIINQVPIYNTSHLFGFFSAFNSDAVKYFSLYKSNIPVNYGGRLSSIFDIKTKQGNKKNFSASGGISPVTARIMVEGPLKKEKSSYMIGIRSTYSDWLLKKVKDPDIKKSDGQFADVVTNFSFELNNNNQLELFSYHSLDKFNLVGQNKYEYANNGASLSWNHLIRERHSLKSSIIYSQYAFNEENSELKINSYKDNFELKHSEIKSVLTLRPNSKHSITAGFNSSLYMIDDGDFRPLNEESIISPIKLGQEKAIESGIFLSDEWSISPRLSLSAGARYNYYLYLGPQEVRTFVDDAPKSYENIVDTIQFANNEVVKSYSAPDFRFAARYIINDNLSVKLSFNQLKQYLFMLTNTIAVSPTDKWKLADYNIKPMIGSQYSLGVYKNLFYGKYEFSLETYYKTVENIVEYKNGANLLVNETPEIDILQGKLKTYGLELMIKKSLGRFNGWINYTYSRAEVVVKSNNLEESINKGESYPSNYDKPNAFNVVTNYKFSRRFSLSSNLVYSTGRPVTYPVGVFYQDDMELLMYSKRNEYRIPDYFRIDFSLKLEGNLMAKKFAHSTWILSVYNLTGRKNAYSVYFKSEEGKINGYRLSIFGVPIVSLTYSFKLGNYAN